MGEALTKAAKVGFVLATVALGWEAIDRVGFLIVLNCLVLMVGILYLVFGPD